MAENPVTGGDVEGIVGFPTSISAVYGGAAAVVVGGWGVVMVAAAVGVVPGFGPR